MIRVKDLSPIDAIRRLQEIHEYTKFETDRVPAQILPGLFLGSIGAAFDKEMLRKSKITYILCCCDGVEPPFPKSFTYKILALEDKRSKDVAQFFEETANFIHDILSQKQKVLVHCKAGKSRSVTIVMSYLMKHRNKTVDEALELIRENRKDVMSNTGFMEQLREYEKVIRSDRV